MAKNLSTLGQSAYMIKNTFDLIGKIKNEQIPLGFTMISFEVKSLLTSVPLTGTINIILDHVYNCKQMLTVLTKDEMKKMLPLSGKNVNFILNNKIYLQDDGVVLGSPQAQILANVFMVKLENKLVPRLHQHV